MMGQGWGMVRKGSETWDHFVSTVCVQQSLEPTFYMAAVTIPISQMG